MSKTPLLLSSILSGQPVTKQRRFSFSPALGPIVPLTILTAVFTSSAFAQSTNAPASNPTPATAIPYLSEPRPVLLQPSPAAPETEIAPPSSFAASQEPATSAIGTPEFAVPATAPSEPLANPLQWGPFEFHPHFNYALTYSSGLLVRPGESSTSLLNSISPGLLVQSKHLSVDYTPHLNYYAKGPYEDTVNHSASLNAGLGYGDWRFHISQGYSKSSNPLIETGIQTETESFNTSLSATWLYNEKLSFDFTAAQQIFNSQGFQNSKQWSTIEWADYHFTDRISAGVGVGGGYTDVDQGSDMTYEQIQGRISWRPGTKLTLNANGGIEIRQFLASTGSADRINPLVGLSASYQLFEHTTISAHVDRSVSPSLYTDQITESTSLSVGVSQRLLGRLNAGVNAGWRNSEYQSSSKAVFANRSDDVTFVGVSLGTRILKKGSISANYQHSKNDSNIDGFSYESDQYTLQLGYRF